MLLSAWVAFKVGALSYGGGFVIIPLMQADAVDHYHWMTDAQFLNAVALGQVTPGPVVQTVAVVGYAAARRRRRAARRRRRLRAVVRVRPARRAGASTGCAPTRRSRAFLDGAGPAAIGAILGSAVPLARRPDRAVAVAVLAARRPSLLLGCAAASCPPCSWRVRWER